MKSGSLMDLFGLSGTRMKGWDGWMSCTWLSKQVKLKTTEARNDSPITRATQVNPGAYCAFISLGRRDGRTRRTFRYRILFLDCGAGTNISTPIKITESKSTYQRSPSHVAPITFHGTHAEGDPSLVPPYAIEVLAADPQVMMVRQGQALLPK